MEVEKKQEEAARREELRLDKEAKRQAGRRKDAKLPEEIKPQVVQGANYLEEAKWQGETNRLEEGRAEAIGRRGENPGSCIIA